MEDFEVKKKENPIVNVYEVNRKLSLPHTKLDLGCGLNRQIGRAHV